MNTTEKALARILFRSRMSGLIGMGFQNEFSRIMSLADPDFSPVKPQGNEGDWKNDGHMPTYGRYYQVYSPETYTESEAIRKLKEDFDGLALKWGGSQVYPTGIQEFYFVINDGNRVTPGAYPTTYAALATLKTAHDLQVCKPFLTKDLEQVLFGLDDDQIVSVVGFIPNPAEIRVLKIDLVSEVVGHIIKNPIIRSLDQSFTDPDFEKKIAFNSLSITANWLRDADYRRATVEQFFEMNGSFCRQTVRDKLKAIYEAGKAISFSDTSSQASAQDQLLAHILTQVTPKSHGVVDRRVEKELHDAALVVMAYFFEACDIFEEPPEC
ncbi:hypothetical protein QN379_00215 [Glaciimonas sp. Gout2]|uniref:ABC-three component system protein n=1 Tax=Glaciimonas sp. Gout2 TaxID=3048625 RepID=UPI002B23272B|nr:ABC-three component system protein [Glaciimonas sp. Gout2]MEB0080442.1 hypothetical protein [Glaciimonas sp. Gout2]